MLYKPIEQLACLHGNLNITGKSFIEYNNNNHVYIAPLLLSLAQTYFYPSHISAPKGAYNA